MTRFRLKHVVADVDRHGNVRYYYRREGQKKVRLRGDYGSEFFMQAYHAADASRIDVKGKRIGLRTSAGSFGYVCLQYFASDAFKGLDSSTQKQRKYFLESVCEKHAHKPIAMMRAEHIEQLIETKKDTPAAARNFLKSLNALFRWGVKKKHLASDPTKDVQPIPYLLMGITRGTSRR